jgi:hypothetical protein
VITSLQAEVIIAGLQLPIRLADKIWTGLAKNGQWLQIYGQSTWNRSGDSFARTLNTEVNTYSRMQSIVEFSLFKGSL